jgi:hypothetical protein
MMSEYILPALDQKPPAPTQAQKTEVVDELQAAEDSKGVPGFALDPNNTNVPQMAEADIGTRPMEQGHRILEELAVSRRKDWLSVRDRACV